MTQIEAAIKIIRSEGVQAPLLITGQNESQIGTTLSNIMQLAVCSSRASTSCGKCRDCRLFKQGIHPDVLILTGTNKTIAIKSVRELLAKAKLKAHSGYKLIVIPKAERLSLPAAQALLKSLEEGSDTTRFVLTTRWKQRLIPTMLSRCQQIILPAPAEKQTVAADDGYSDFSAKSTLQHMSAARDLTDKDIDGIAAELKRELSMSGASGELLTAFLRLRDYYRIKSKRGNCQLAKEVLAASLPSKNSGK